MPVTVPSKFWLMALAPVSVAITAIAWSGNQSTHQLHQYIIQDTVPSKEKPARKENFPKADKDPDGFERESLDKTLEKLGAELKKINWNNLQSDVDGAVRKANLEKIHEALEQSLKQIDIEKMHEAVDQSLKQIDLEKIHEAVDQSLKQIDLEKIQKETLSAMQQAQKNADFKEMNREIEASLEKMKSYLHSEAFRELIRDAAARLDSSRYSK